MGVGKARKITHGEIEGRSAGGATLDRYRRRGLTGEGPMG